MTTPDQVPNVELGGDVVSNLVKSALFDSLQQYDTTPDADRVNVEGVQVLMAFHRPRMEATRATMCALINQLPLQFLSEAEGGGGGWSFLNLCLTRDERLWTGMHSTMDSLLALGIGLGLARFLMPREMWNVLPGRMPYVVFWTRYAPPSPVVPS